MAMTEEEKKKLLSAFAKQMDESVAEGGTGSEVYKETGDFDYGDIIDADIITLIVDKSKRQFSQQQAKDANEWADWLSQSLEYDGKIGDGMPFKFQGKLYTFNEGVTSTPQQQVPASPSRGQAPAVPSRGGASPKVEEKKGKPTASATQF